MPPDDSQTAISAFSRPESELTGLILSVENILRHYYHQEPRFPVNPEDEDLVRLCGYRSEYGGNFAQLQDRLNNKLVDTAYTAHSDYAIDIEELSEIINEDNFSLPLVELHPDYFEEVDYIVQPGHLQKNETPILIPIAIDDGQVMYWDPLADFYFGGVDDTRERPLSDTTFITLWSEATKMNWTFWLSRGQQTTLTGFRESES